MTFDSLDVDCQQDAVLAALLPLDVSRSTLDRLFERGLLEQLSTLCDRVERYFDRAENNHTSVEPVQFPFQDPAEIVLLPAITAFRVAKADPLKDSRNVAVAPENSPTERMLRTPLWTNPGLPNPLNWIRAFHTATAQSILRTTASLETKLRVAELLTTTTPPDPPEAIYSAPEVDKGYIKAIQFEENEPDSIVFRIPRSSATERCRFHTTNDAEQLPPLTVTDDYVEIPFEVLLKKYRRYTKYAWDRIVNRFYNRCSDIYVTRAVCKQTPTVDDSLRVYFESLDQDAIYGQCYGTNSQPPHLRSGQNTLLPMPRPDKHLVTVVDAIRSTPNAAFNTKYTASDLHDLVRQYQPPPHRPSNTLSDVSVLSQVLDDAYSDVVTKVSQPDGPPEYCISQPEYSPLYPSVSIFSGFRWECYQAWLQVHQNERLAADSRLSQSKTIDAVNSVDPPLFDQAGAVDRAHRASVTEAKKKVCSYVPPRIDPHKQDDLTRDEIIFLTRVGLGMRRLLAIHDITDSMRELDSGLDVDPKRLIENGYLNRHDLLRTYYSVPWDVAERLGIPNVSNEGYGEITPSEGLPHRLTVTATAELVARDPNVDTVWTYTDLWRFEGPAGDVPEDHRGDVIGVSSEGVVTVVGEIETSSGDRHKVHNTLDYLEDMKAAGADRTILATPDGEDLADVLQIASDPEYLDLDSLPASTSKPSNWRNYLDRNGALGEFFDEIYTYRALLNEVPEL